MYNKLYFHAISLLKLLGLAIAILFCVFIVLVLVNAVSKELDVDLLKSVDDTSSYKVTQVFDGDTIEVLMNGKKEKVRFIGVDTPETGGHNTNVECYGKEATAFTKEKLEGQRVILESDELTGNRDRYDRLLRYVIRSSDKLNINYELLSNGYSAEYSVFPFTRSADFAAASAKAEEHNLGLWASCNK